MIFKLIKRWFSSEKDEVLWEEINNIHIEQHAIDSYKKYVKGYTDASDEEVRKKIIRNFMLGIKTRETDSYKRSEYYNLILHSHKDNGKISIYNIYNRKGHQRRFNIDQELKIKLDELLGL